MSVFFYIIIILTCGYRTDANFHLLGLRQLTGTEQATDFTCIFKRTNNMDYSIKELFIKKGEDMLAVVNEQCNVRVLSDEVTGTPTGKIDNVDGTSFLRITVKKKDDDPNNRYSCFAIATSKDGAQKNLTASVTPQISPKINKADSSPQTPTVSIVNQGCDCQQLNALSQSLNQNQTKLTNEFNKLQQTLTEKLNKFQESQQTILKELDTQKKLQSVVTKQVVEIAKTNFHVEIDQVLCGTEAGGFPKNDKGVNVVEIPVKFPTPFKSPPKVFYSIRHFAMRSNKTIQFLVKTVDITKDGFTMICGMWGDVIVTKLATRWIAFGE